MSDQKDTRQSKDNKTPTPLKPEDHTQLLTDIIDNTPIILFCIDYQGIIRMAEGKGLKKLHLCAESIIGNNIFSCFQQFPDTLANFRRALAGEEMCAVEKIGSRMFEFWYKPRFDAASGQYEVTGIATDVSDLKRTEYALRQSRALLAEAQKIAHMGNWTCLINTDGNHHSPYWSDEIFNILGLKKQKPDFALLFNMIHEEDRSRFLKAFENSRESGQPYSVEYRITTPTGETRVIHERGMTKLDESGQQISVHGTMQNISERRKAEHFLHKAANFDTLTGLPNRILFKEHLNQAIAQAHRNHQFVALLALDLDNFRYINESLGHKVGDRLLWEASKRLRKSVREGDTLSRFSGDEFTIIMEGITNTNDITTQVQQMIRRMNKQYLIDGHELFCSPSMGIAIYPHDANNADDLIKHTDMALRNAKEQGKNTYQFFTADLNSRTLERLLFENALRHALGRNELELHYQPQVNLNNGHILGVEALIRWRHPQMGLIAPEQFIPLAEKSGLIVPIGKWVMETACQQARQWSDSGIAPLRMSVNLSAQQVAQPGLVTTVGNILGSTGLNPQYLKLELTESMLFDDSSQTREVLNQLHALGVRISIDDFGTGYSSLSYLKRMPLDTLKIDRSFVRDLPHDADDAAISQAIIAMARSLDMKVIAEGVESQEQLDFLNAQMCDEAQGYFLGKPQSAADIGPWLSERFRIQNACRA